MAASIEMSWNPADFPALLRSCEFDDGVQLALRCLPDKGMRILEAGCGTGRVVKYLYDLGYHNIDGIELNGSIVKWATAEFSELRIIAGDILAMPYDQETFDAVLAFGVIEHFVSGPIEALHAIARVLKSDGGIAVVTVPSFNHLRTFLHPFDVFVGLITLRTNPWVRRLFRKKPLSRCITPHPHYYVHPQRGPFYEYRFTPEQFVQACKISGFDVLQSEPISHVDGLYHIFGPPLVRFRDWRFTVSPLGMWLNRLLTKQPFLHNHMHACVIRKRK